MSDGDAAHFNAEVEMELVTVKFAAQEQEAVLVRAYEGQATVVLRGSTQPRRFRVVTTRERFDATDDACVLMEQYEECPVCLMQRCGANDPEHDECREHDGEHLAELADRYYDEVRDARALRV